MPQGPREALRYPYSPFCVQLDDVEASTRNVVVCKGRFDGGRYTLARGAVVEPAFAPTWPAPGTRVSRGDFG